MNTNRTLVPISMLILCLAKPCPAERILSGVSFVSPNGRYSVDVEEVNGVAHLALADTLRKESDNYNVISTQLFYLHWAPNSRCFVTVEQIAHGSFGRVVYLSGGTWENVEIRPPCSVRTAVINLRLLTRKVHYKFAVTTLTPDGKPIDYRFCDLDVSLGTGKISNIRWAPISQEELAVMRRREPQYMPPMTGQGAGKGVGR